MDNRGLVSTTGSMINIDRADVTTMGIGGDLFRVPETAVYRTIDGAEARRYVAGDLIPRGEAERFQMNPPAIEEGAPVINAVEGEKIAALLRAAGYDLGEPNRSVDVSIDPATNAGVGGNPAVSSVQQAEKIQADQPAGSTEYEAEADYKQWYRNILDANPDAERPYKGETQAAYRERTGTDNGA